MKKILTNTKLKNQNESGMSLLSAVFALVFLSAMGLAVVQTSAVGSVADSNNQSSSKAFYASNAGLEWAHYTKSHLASGADLTTALNKTLTLDSSSTFTVTYTESTHTVKSIGNADNAKSTQYMTMANAADCVTLGNKAYANHSCTNISGGNGGIGVLKGLTILKNDPATYPECTNVNVTVADISIDSATNVNGTLQIEQIFRGTYSMWSPLLIKPSKTGDGQIFNRTTTTETYYPSYATTGGYQEDINKDITPVDLLTANFTDFAVSTTGTSFPSVYLSFFQHYYAWGNTCADEPVYGDVITVNFNFTDGSTASQDVMVTN